jgi:hypothetical protein
MGSTRRFDRLKAPSPSTPLGTLSLSNGQGRGAHARGHQKHVSGFSFQLFSNQRFPPSTLVAASMPRCEICGLTARAGRRD